MNEQISVETCRCNSLNPKRSLPFAQISLKQNYAYSAIFDSNDISLFRFCCKVISEFPRAWYVFYRPALHETCSRPVQIDVHKFMVFEKREHRSSYQEYWVFLTNVSRNLCSSFMLECIILHHIYFYILFESECAMRSSVDAILRFLLMYAGVLLSFDKKKSSEWIREFYNKHVISVIFLQFSS